MDETSKQKITELQHQLRRIQLQNAELAEQLTNCENTPYTLYRLIKPLLTLDEYQLHNAIVETIVAFTSATKVGLYLVDSEYKAFHLVASYGIRSEKISSCTSYKLNSSLFRLLAQTKHTLSIKEIVTNKPLYTLWRQQTMPAIIYTPIVNEQQLKGIIIIYELPLQKLHRATLRTLEIIADLAAVALKNATRHQVLFDKFPLPQEDFLLDFRHFRQAVDFEFRRSQRHQLALSVVLMAITAIGNAKLPSLASPFWNKIAEILHTNLRTIDYISTGEKIGCYWLLLPLTQLEGTAVLMERLQHELIHSFGTKSHYKVLMGFATYHPTIRSAQELLQKARHGLRLHRFVQKLLYT
ncbi:hypothetical protein DRQ15_01160 [candidate division KSB1 bacterium]|nr:MAG: hypothetical protein DRQ15_01160 [candidate division KSB1 bacterium]